MNLFNFFKKRTAVECIAKKLNIDVALLTGSKNTVSDISEKSTILCNVCNSANVRHDIIGDRDTTTGCCSVVTTGYTQFVCRECNTVWDKEPITSPIFIKLATARPKIKPKFFI